MLGKGDSDFILGKKKKKGKEKQNKKKQHLTCQKNTDRQNIGTHTQTIKKSSGDGGLIVYLHRGIEN